MDLNILTIFDMSFGEMKIQKLLSISFQKQTKTNSPLPNVLEHDLNINLSNFFRQTFKLNFNAMVNIQMRHVLVLFRNHIHFLYWQLFDGENFWEKKRKYFGTHLTCVRAPWQLVLRKLPFNVW